MAKKKKEIPTKERQLITQIIDRELVAAQSNTQSKVNDFELSIDLLECERTERNADWMSDIFLPEFPSQMLTQSSIEANQYFQTRDFVEVYLEDEDAKAIASADANRELINRTLNQRHLRFFQKFMRANITKNIGGEVYLRCGWERKYKNQNMKVTRMIPSETEDVYGNAIIDRNIQQPAMVQDVSIESRAVIDYDRFNFDIIDRRHVFTDNTYCYSLQEKPWIIIRAEKTLDQLYAEADQEGYTDLEALKEVKPQTETKTSEESYNKDRKEMKVEQKGNMPFDVYHRYGKTWALVRSYDDWGNPLEIDIGIDDDGNPMEKAELVESIVSIVVSGSARHIIRFIALPFIDAFGNPYRNIIRGQCYIHPTKDEGLGDGKFCRELQVGMNDTFNISNDRVMLATLPTMKGRKYAIEDNPSVYFEPGHTINLENTDDLVEFQISDNIEGALSQIALLKQSMSGVTSIFPPDLGSLPELASTTATAVAGAQQSKNMRANYRSLTNEHTFLNELYWMITQMTWQFATEETAYRLMGNKAPNFDPTAEFTYKPLSQSIESEYSKANKVKELIQLSGLVTPIAAVNPKGVPLLNFMLAKIFTYYGDEYATFGKFLLDENAPISPPQGQPGKTTGMAVSNQNGMPMSAMEGNLRETASMGMGM